MLREFTERLRDSLKKMVTSPHRPSRQICYGSHRQPYLQHKECEGKRRRIPARSQNWSTFNSGTASDSLGDAEILRPRSKSILSTLGVSTTAYQIGIFLYRMRPVPIEATVTAQVQFERATSMFKPMDKMPPISHSDRKFYRSCCRSPEYRFSAC
ncbi:hypothetical protein ACRE_054230 [Hapsidospora chrysogenum ATCC 11550]|uniref:Uncharacterized protein n=1 Tax=Hapsidospora chrysogenum (strain ATCC 11550 / CBS 779.69 / DSM 880 / IAM 14645 / JCM 23072 / IMI 49137) TaxID=857340 RepID=A0A086T371_HAPC1|nr:hypothetical protein ACRE_054230 [Hapsidospora chrysogenum ATCC 11550]